LVAAEGGGNWFDVTVPDGAAASGAGARLLPAGENRSLVQPARASAASDTAINADLLCGMNCLRYSALCTA